MLTLGYNGQFPKKLEVPDNALYGEFTGVGSSPRQALYPSFVKIWGTKYEAGDIVIINISVESFGILKAGLISSIIVDGERVNFACDLFQSRLNSGGFYNVVENYGTCVVNSDELADHHPLLLLSFYIIIYRTGLSCKSRARSNLNY